MAITNWQPPARYGDPAQGVLLRVRLVKKLADVLNGVDLSDRSVGETFDCSQSVARMLALEGWAEIVGGQVQSAFPAQGCGDRRDGWHAHATVKVHIIRQPLGRVDGIALKHYHPGQSYELPAALANYLVIEGYAIVEMRNGPRLNSPGPRSVSITQHRSSRRR